MVEQVHRKTELESKRWVVLRRHDALELLVVLSIGHWQEKGVSLAVLVRTMRIQWNIRVDRAFFAHL